MIVRKINIFTFFIQIDIIFKKLEKQWMYKMEQVSEKIYSVNEIKEILCKYLANTKVQKVILVGSYSKNMATKTRDIDLIIDTNGTLRGFAFIELVLELENLFNKNIDGFQFNEIVENSSIDKEIQNTGVVVYEK